MAPSFIEVTAAIIREDGKILIAQRGSGHLSGKWEFPGGKVDGDEDVRVSLQREIQEELGIIISVEEPFHTVVHDYGVEGTIRLHSFFCKIIAGEPKPRSHINLAWVTAGELGDYNFAPADIPIVERLVS